MRFLTICNNCKFKSTYEERYCPNCGEEKDEDISKKSIRQSIMDDIAARVDFVESPEIYIRLLFRIVLFVCGVFLIPKFVQESMMFLIILYIYALFGIVKEFERRIPKLVGIYLFAKLLTAAYFGAGFGNVVTHTGKIHNYSFNYFFNIEFLIKEMARGNMLIFIGALSVATILLSVTYLYRQLRGERII